MAPSRLVRVGVRVVVGGRVGVRIRARDGVRVRVRGWSLVGYTFVSAVEKAPLSTGSSQSSTPLLVDGRDVT